MVENKPILALKAKGKIIYNSIANEQMCIQFLYMYMHTCVNLLYRHYKNHEQILKDTLYFYCNLRSKYEAVDVILEFQGSPPMFHGTPGNTPLNTPVTAADGTHTPDIMAADITHTLDAPLHITHNTPSDITHTHLSYHQTFHHTPFIHQLLYQKVLHPLQPHQTTHTHLLLYNPLQFVQGNLYQR